jgi:hypothetical protein
MHVSRANIYGSHERKTLAKEVEIHHSGFAYSFEQGLPLSILFAIMTDSFDYVIAGSVS